MSYLEKARAATGGPGAARHVRRAQALVTRVRQEVSQDARAVAKELRTALDSQNALAGQVAAGRLTPEDANARNRAVSARIAELRSRIAACNAALAAQSVESLGGFADLELGAYARALSRAGARPWWQPTARGFVVWLVCLVAGTAAVLWHAGLLASGPSLKLDVSNPDAPGGVVRVVVRNDGAAPVTVVVPWVEPEPGEPASRYGVAVYVRAKAGEAFRRAPALPEAWKEHGRPLMEAMPFTLAPRLGLELEFEPRKVPALDGAAEVRLALCSETGRIVTKRDLPLHQER